MDDDEDTIVSVCVLTYIRKNRIIITIVGLKIVFIPFALMLLWKRKQRKHKRGQWDLTGSQLTCARARLPVLLCAWETLSYWFSDFVPWPRAATTHPMHLNGTSCSCNDSAFKRFVCFCYCALSLVNMWKVSPTLPDRRTKNCDTVNGHDRYNGSCRYENESNCLTM